MSDSRTRDIQIPTNWATRDSRTTNRLEPEIVNILPAVQRIFHELSLNGKYELTITGGQEWGHKVFSKHHTGFAIDIRTQDLPGGGGGIAAHEAKARVEKLLGPKYLVILEHSPYHLHIEFKPGRTVSDPLDLKALTGNTRDLV